MNHRVNQQPMQCGQSQNMSLKLVRNIWTRKGRFVNMQICKSNLLGYDILNIPPTSI